MEEKMKIGIDLGGSHIAIGIVENGVIIKKFEHNFFKEEKEILNSTIENFINSTIDEILKTVGLNNIEMVGISVPRTSSKWIYTKFAKFKS
jgi:predicted NBD/HSP70 family sugar kinase